MRELTIKQRQALDIVAGQMQETGSPPTVRELAAALGLKSPSSAQRHLEPLQKKGYLERPRRNCHGLRLTDRALREMTACPCCKRPYAESEVAA